MLGSRKSERWIGGLVVPAMVTVVAATSLVACQLPGRRFVVNSTQDGADLVPGDGVCEVTGGAGDCTLRAAVMEANAEAGTNDIEIGDGHRYLLTAGGNNDLLISDSVSINGHSSIDGNQTSPVLDIGGGTAFIDGVTITGGHGEANGAGVRVESNAHLVLSNAVVRDNESVAANGGGIFNRGTLDITNTSFVNNRALSIFITGPDGETFLIPADGDSIVSQGGAVTVARSMFVGGALGSSGHDVIGSGPITIHSSTFVDRGGFSGQISMDESTVSAPSIDPGTGVFEQGTFVVTSSTFADLPGALFHGDPAGVFSLTATMSGSAVSTAGSACDPPPTGNFVLRSGGYNVLSDNSCHLNGVGDRQGVAPQLGPLADNGGPSLTRLPAAGSPLLDAIPFPTDQLCMAGSTDQRGVTRPVNGRCDIGSVEGHA